MTLNSHGHGEDKEHGDGDLYSSELMLDGDNDLDDFDLEQDVKAEQFDGSGGAMEMPQEGYIIIDGPEIIMFPHGTRGLLEEIAEEAARRKIFGRRVGAITTSSRKSRSAFG